MFPDKSLIYLAQMKKTKIPNIVNLAILTVVTTVFWIVFEVIRTLTLKPDTYVSPAVIKSLSPELDTKLLDEIR